MGDAVLSPISKRELDGVLGGKVHCLDDLLPEQGADLSVA